MSGHFDFISGATYTVTKDFSDFENNWVTCGARLTYITKGFDSGSGCFIFVFKERKLRLHEGTNKALLDSLQDYLSLDTMPPSEDVGMPAPSAGLDRGIVSIARERPRQVAQAVNLLWFTLAMGVGAVILNFLKVQPKGGILAVALSITFLVIVAKALFIGYLSVGRNWARMLFLIALIYNLVALLFFPADLLVRALMSNLVYNLFYITQLLVECVAMYLVFTFPGSAWFRRDQ